MDLKLKRNTLYYGDCLDLMRAWPDACADLIYLDPPFNSDADYNVIFGARRDRSRAVKRKDSAQLVAFTDTWEWDSEVAQRIAEIKKSGEHRARTSVLALGALHKGGSGMLAYLVYMADRVNEMHRLLKDTGSLYFHCDQTASAYLKIILDDVFGVENFRDMIIWRRAVSAQKGNQYAPKKWGSNADHILFYSKSRAAQLRPWRALSAEEEAAKFNRVDENGERYDAPGHLWRNPGQGERPNLCYEWRGFTNPHPSGWRLTKARLEEEFQKGNVVISADGAKLERRAYARDYKGEAIANIWNDIAPVAPRGKEYLGYKTQKPLALVERIIRASSRPGDLVMDTFCGCGTTVEAAMNLKRDFVGVDISMFALDVLQKERLKSVKFVVEGTPSDMPAAEDMAVRRPFAFEKWAVHLTPGLISNNKQSGDGGVDGHGFLLHTPDDAGDPDHEGLVIAQVKGGKPNVDALRAFAGKLGGGYASMGVFITLKKWDTPTVRNCIAAAGTLQLGASVYNRLAVWSVEEFFDGRAANIPPLAHPRTGQAFQDDVLTRK